MRFLYKPFLWYMKKWDIKTKDRPSAYFSISQNVAERIKRYYNRDSVMIYPPVDTEYFQPQSTDKDYFLVVSALVPYKRIDIVIDAFNKLQLPLKIIGTGTEFHKLKKQANNNIEFLGWLTDNEVRDYYAGCKALLFPGIEDFGITVLEAQSCGRPVIAYNDGGAKETVDSNIPTGLFFDEQTPELLIQAVNKFNDIKGTFNKDKIREHAQKFNRKSFTERLKNEIQRVYNSHYNH